ncbi:MAG TPA: bifunctional diguanylate cyclase/phosphodiesterase [Burkholderiaceae bacterium]
MQLIGLPACACDVGGAIIAANAELALWLGKDAQQLQGQEIGQFLADATRGEDLVRLGLASEPHRPQNSWLSALLGRSGILISVQICAKPLGWRAGSLLVFTDITRSQRDETALRKTLLEQSALMDNAAVGIIFSKPGMIQECNLRAAEMMGCSREEILGRSTRHLFPTDEDYIRFFEKASPLLRAGQPYRAETQLMRKDGELFWCSLYGNAIDPLHPDEGTIWIADDVTESRRDQLALRQTMIEVEAIMTNASISILFTKNRQITRYNRGFAEMFGYGPEEALGMPGAALYPGADEYARVGSLAFPLLSVGRQFQTETEMQRKDGSRLWAQLIGYVVNPEDTAAGTIWIIEDRTEHKAANETLRNALLENQAILDSAVLGIAVVENGHTLRCNRQMEVLFGYDPGEVDGLSIQSLYSNFDDWNAARIATANDFSAGRVHMDERLLIRKDGTKFWARLSGRPFDLSQPKGRSVWLLDDVTARREAAEAVLRARDELEVRVHERTAALAGANLKLQAEIGERHQAEARIQHMAYHDSLTGLPNRSLLTDRLDRAILDSQRGLRRLAVMFLDLDRFKTINDSLGHVIGDHLLKEVAVRLSNAVRASDTVSRLGGDEFVILLTNLETADEAAPVAQKIIDALALPIDLEGRQLHITPSIGICVFPDDGRDAETLMRNADAAMYHAKASGRNNYQFFTERLNQIAKQHFELETSLRGALARDEFELHFQPIMDIATRTLRSMEVLLRWRRPGKGLVGPNDFIPIIEENGLIVPVGEWVMRRACEQNMEWRRQGYETVPLAVNLSPRQFLHRGLVASVRNTLALTGIDPSMLEFEITETALMEHGEQTLSILNQMNRMGIRLSIDDFGTGYSSLAYLKRFPVKKIKIDRAFIKDLEHSSDDRAIVAAIVALSDSLQLSVVAEGVETQAQFELLHQSGCQLAQGYLFSRPVPAEDARYFLQASQIKTA